MSGGVDSSVAAYLLVQQGFQVTGATMKLFDNQAIGAEAESSCCSLSDVEDARRVAYALGIPHHVFNFSEDFRTQVMDRFVRCYQQGLTPNPCIDCNRYLKFQRMLRRARELEIWYVATGHYARRAWDGERWLLKKGLDADKDQSLSLIHISLADPADFAQRYQVEGASPLLFAVGDGNHSLAAAKASYEEKKGTPAENLARYALVELVNLHDESLEFEPIHRVCFGVDSKALLEGLLQAYPGAHTGEGEGQRFVMTRCV